MANSDDSEVKKIKNRKKLRKYPKIGISRFSKYFFILTYSKESYPYFKVRLHTLAVTE